VKPGHPVILERDRYSPLYVIRCDRAACTVPMDKLVRMGCQPEGCWLAGALTLEGAERLIAERGARVTTRRV
jgi:hypothetical protein